MHTLVQCSTSLRRFCAEGAFPPLDMGLRRSLLSGTGWAGTIGALALCVLVFLALYVAAAGRPDSGRVVELPSVREGRVALHPPGRGAPSPAPARPTPSGSGGGGDGR
jgi:hypothetical protein